MLTSEEEVDLDIKAEESTAKSCGMRFLRLPILDRQVPESQSRFARALAELDAELAAGRNVALHCRQGIGRTGLVAACLLIDRGLDPSGAVRRLTAARGLPIPETPEQRDWIDQYAPAHHA